MTGKEMWDEPGQATAAMAHKGVKGTIRAYRCPFCEQYHQTGAGNRKKKRGKR